MYCYDGNSVVEILAYILRCRNERVIYLVFVGEFFLKISMWTYFAL